MTSAQVVETSVNVTTKSPSQDYTHPDVHNLLTYDMTPGFKPFTVLLNFTCSANVPGRVFLRRLIDLTVGLSLPHHFVRLKKEVKEDLRVWQPFLARFKGKSVFLEDIWQSSAKLNLFTDA